MLDFVYLKTRPNDFYSGKNQPKEWQINLDTIEEEKNKDKNRFGIVINHDNNGQSGSHWVALYFDLKKGKYLF